MPSPFAWPAGSAALIMIDWQKDFVDPGGFGASLGNNVTQLLPAVPFAASVLAAARTAAIPGGAAPLLPFVRFLVPRFKSTTSSLDRYSTGSMTKRIAIEL